MSIFSLSNNIAKKDFDNCFSIFISSAEIFDLQTLATHDSRQKISQFANFIIQSRQTNTFL